jgi:hypothetical protein
MNPRVRSVAASMGAPEKGNELSDDAMRCPVGFASDVKLGLKSL